MKTITQSLLCSTYLLLSGCFALTDLDRFEVKDNVFVMHLRNLTPHIDKRVSVSLISASNFVQARAVISRMDTADISFAMPGAMVDNDEHHVDFFSDDNQNERYDPPTGTTVTDHSWREPVPASGQMTFCHNTNFADLTESMANPIGGNFAMLLRQMDQYLGSPMEFHVIETSLERTVGLFRLSEVRETEALIFIPGIMDSGSSYRVDFYVDVNRDGVYLPADDTAWRIELMSDSLGIDTELNITSEDANDAQIELDPAIFEVPGEPDSC